MLNRGARTLARGASNLLYHNHDFEFASEGRAVNTLLNDTVDALGWCPDIGWLMKGGKDVPELFDDVKDRIGAVLSRTSRRTGPLPSASATQWSSAKASRRSTKRPSG